VLLISRYPSAHLEPSAAERVECRLAAVLAGHDEVGTLAALESLRREVVDPAIAAPGRPEEAVRPLLHRVFCWVGICAYNAKLLIEGLRKAGLRE
jgi:hypothetical protein